MANSLSGEIQGRIQAAQRFLIVSHIRPDGDAIGSLLGLGLALQEAGKDVQMVLSDGVPANFRFLEGWDQVIKKSKTPADMVIVVDCSDLLRAGSALKGQAPDKASVPDLNIDHHITNLNFAQINLVETEAVATAEVLARYIPEWGLPLTTPVASALLTGLITDTLGFRTSNMSPGALRTSAKLMEAGAPLSELYYAALVSHSFEAASFWGRGLEKVQRAGGLVWTTLTHDDRTAAGYSGRDDADLINVLSAIEGAQVAVIFVEQPGEKIKISWRARPGIDVSQVALAFGGGGHKAASGAEVAGSLDNVVERVLSATQSSVLDEGNPS